MAKRPTRTSSLRGDVDALWDRVTVVEMDLKWIKAELKEADLKKIKADLEWMKRIGGRFITVLVLVVGGVLAGALVAMAQWLFS